MHPFASEKNTTKTQQYNYIAVELCCLYNVYNCIVVWVTNINCAVKMLCSSDTILFLFLVLFLLQLSYACRFYFSVFFLSIFFMYRCLKNLR